MTSITASHSFAVSAPAQTGDGSQEPVVAHQNEQELPSHPTAAGIARRHARQLLTDWGMEDEEIFDALLVVSELVTNSVEHALPPIALHLKVTSAADGSTQLHANVTDGGPAPSDGAWTSSCAADEHGRGHDIVAALAEFTTFSGTDNGAEYGATLTATCAA
ncbi:ATP-binding protein [Streptomyces sp. NPDC020817]|uniref:ATP-binding protein n=1 Tax=Streptomyces sp. NPDC020817 TaxID=3365095 RepID=UPI0037B20D64